MQSHEVKKHLLELFPQLTEEQADALARTGDDISILVTRVLDGNVEPPVVDIKDLYRSDSSNTPILQCKRSSRGTHNAYYSSRLPIPEDVSGTPQGTISTISTISTIDTTSTVGHYNYPEAFEVGTQIDMHADVRALRRRAAELMRTPSTGKDPARALNRAAALVLMRRIVEGGVVDLHGLTVEEAMGFMDDYRRFTNYERIRVITGQEHNSKRIRPAVKKWLERNGFEWKDDGAAVVGERMKHL